MRQFSINKLVAVEPLPQAVIEKKVQGGLVLNASRTDLIRSRLVMSYIVDGTVYAAGAWNVILRGDAPFQPFAKSVMVLDGKEIVFIPEAVILAFEEIGSAG